MISGWVMDAGPQEDEQVEGQRRRADRCAERYGSDAVRWRAAKARPGLDSPFDEAEMKVGRRLALKILNAGKFVLGYDGTGELAESPSRLIGRCWR